LRESLAGLRKVLGPAVAALGPKRSATLSLTPTAIEVDTLRLETVSGSEDADTLEQVAQASDEPVSKICEALAFAPQPIFLRLNLLGTFELCDAWRCIAAH